MNPEIVTLVRQSWASVLPAAPQAATLFFRHLFARNPSLRVLCAGGLTDDERLFVGALDAVVARLDELDQLIPLLQHMGSQQAAWGVRDEHYRSVGDALLATLGEQLGDSFTGAVREAWSVTIDLIATVMIDAGPARDPDAIF